MMKKRLWIVLGILVVLALSSCNKNKPEENISTEEITETETSTTETTPQATTDAVTESGQTEEGTEDEQGKVVIYKGNPDATGLVEEKVEMKEITAENLVKELIRVKVLEEDCKVISFEVKDRIATLNLNTVPTYGTSGESVLLTSIGNTFTKAFEVEKVRLLIDSKNYSSGHIELTDSDYLTYNKNFKVLGQ